MAKSSHSHLTIEERWAIVAFRKRLNWTEEKVAKKIGCNQSTVSSIMATYNETNDVIDRPNDREPEIRAMKRKVIEDMVISHPQHSSTKLCWDIILSPSNTDNLSISARSIREYRKELGFHLFHFRRRPFSSHLSSKKRLSFAQSHLLDEWKDVIFSDEKVFVLTSRGNVYWKRPEDPELIWLEPTYPKKVMVWEEYGGMEELIL